MTDGKEEREKEEGKNIVTKILCEGENWFLAECHWIVALLRAPSKWREKVPLSISCSFSPKSFQLKKRGLWLSHQFWLISLLHLNAPYYLFLLISPSGMSKRPGGTSCLPVLHASRHFVRNPPPSLLFFCLYIFLRSRNERVPRLLPPAWENEVRIIQT